MKSITIDACHTMQDRNMINALLGLADQVSGFIGWTIEPESHGAGIQYSFMKPVNPRQWMTQQKSLPRYIGLRAGEGAH